MRATRSARLAFGLWGATLVMVVLYLRFLLALPVSRWTEAISFLPVALGLSTTGALVAFRLPKNPVGWIASAAALHWSAGWAAGRYVDYLLLADDPTRHFLLGALAWWTGVGLAPLFGLFVFLLLLFPTGRLASTRWRPVAALTIAGVAAVTVGSALAPGSLLGYPEVVNPLGLGGWVGAVAVYVRQAIVLVFGFCLPASVASLFSRFRGARGEERQQLKWLVYAAALFALAGGWSLVGGLLGLTGPPAFAPLLLALPGVPAAMGIAILRYRLYEIDRIISRSVTYAVVVGLVVALYVGGVFLVQQVVGAEGDLAVAASTLLAAAAFSPLRRRVQRSVERRFNRSRYDAERVVEGLATRLRERVELEVVAAELVGAARSALQPATATVWVRKASR